MARAWKLAYSAKIGMRKLAPAGQNRAGSNKRLCWKMADESADDSSDDKYDHGGGDSYNSQSASDSETSGSSPSFSEASNERPKRAKRRMKRKYDEDSCDSFGLSNSSWYKKASVPLVFSGVIVNFVQIALEMFQRLSKMVVRSEHAVVVYGTVVVDQKALSPGACLYQQNLFGISPPISVEDADNITKDGYKVMLESLIKMFKDGQYSWVKQGEVSFASFG